MFLLVLALAAAQDPTIIDLGDHRAALTWLTDGKQHYVALDLEDPTERLFYGDGTTMYRAPVQGYGAELPKAFDMSLLDPRYKGHIRLGLADGVYSVECGEKRTVLTRVSDEAARALAGPATFRRSPREYRPYALARDSRGTYYYVDKGRWPENEKRFRVFAGPRGAMKKLELNNIVSDSEGDIFSTPRGELRLIMDQGMSWWIAAKNRVTLTNVPIEANVPMIFNELGVYAGERLGLPCDDW